jgi:hypothetical protein
LFVAAGNTIYLVLVSLAVSFLFVWMVRRKAIRLYYFISGLKGVLCGTLFWTITLFITNGVSDIQEYVITAVSFAIMVAVGVTSVKNKTTISTVFSVWMTGASAFLIKVMFSDLAVGILLVGFSFFDIYDVFKGPLKQLAQTSKDRAVSPLLVKVGAIEVGLGDLLFYSLSVGLAYSVGGFLVAALSITAIKIGMWITLKILEKKPMLPGLPVPVLLSVSVTFLASLLIQVSH